MMNFELKKTINMMKRWRWLLAVWVFPLAGVLIGCNTDGDDDGPEEPAIQGATKQVMVVFAPGQLGDKGYADRVMDGIVLTESRQSELETPEADVNYISMTDPLFTLKGLQGWLDNARNPFTGKDYERRLLVLTESYMLEWLSECSTALRDSDEVLVLKAVQEDLDRASALELGGHIHALNISAALSARRFAEYMDLRIAYEEERGRGDFIDPTAMNMLRLYDPEDVAYRDSIFETLMELRDDNLELSEYTLSAIDNYGTYSPLLEENIIQAAYDSGLMLNNKVRSEGTIFTFVDLGAANLSFDYYLMRQPSFSYTTLMLDAQPSPLRRFAIDRRFDIAVSEWVTKWMETPLGEMPQAVSFGGENYCQDNISTEL